MAALITTGSWPKRLVPGVKGWVMMAMRDLVPEYTQFMHSIKSDRRFEEFVSGTEMSLAQQRDEGDGLRYDSFEQGLTTRLTYVEFVKAFQITKRAQDDDQYGKDLAQKGSKKAARMLMRTKDIVCSNLLNNGFGTSGVFGRSSGLGNQLFSSTQTRGDGGTYSNVLSTAAPLSEAALESMLTAIRQQVDEGGHTLGLKGKKLIVPPALEFQAKRLLGNPNRPATSDRDINAIYALNSLPDGYVVNDHLTDSNNWFILTDGVDPEEGLVLIERNSIAITGDNDFDTDNAKFKAVDSYIPSWINPRIIMGTNP
jgi:hypothetical protein